MAIFDNLSSTSSHLHPLQVENCGSNSRLVVDKDDNSKLRLERVNHCYWEQNERLNIKDLKNVSSQIKQI